MLRIGRYWSGSHLRIVGGTEEEHGHPQNIHGYFGRFQEPKITRSWPGSVGGLTQGFGPQHQFEAE